MGKSQSPSSLNDPLYKKIASEIADMITDGTFAFGDRLPSIRKLKLSRQVSAPTVIEALRVLEDKGLVEARSRSGYFVIYRPLKFRTPSAGRITGRPAIVNVLGISAPILNAAARPGLLPFGAAVPSAELFPVAKLKQIMSALLRRHSMSLGSYTFAPGVPELRVEIAQRALRWGCSLRSENITVTNGCVEAVGLALRAVTSPGDIVAVESPGYYGFYHMLEMLGLKAIEIPSDVHSGISLEHLDRAIESYPIKACLVSTTVTNPCGATMPRHAKKALVERLAAEKITLIEDATFADLQFEGDTIAAKSFDKAGDVLLCASLTKTIAPGLRTGWIEGGRHAEKIGFLKRVTSIGQTELTQRVLAEYLAVGGVDRHLRRMRGILSDQVDRHLAAIAHFLPPTIRVSRPSGGFLLWLQMPRNIDSLELHVEALDLGIGLAPGTMFSAKADFSSYMRINCGQVWKPEVEAAYGRLSQVMTRKIILPE
jgi:DNA-binding transcriptional MocR family regulator